MTSDGYRRGYVSCAHFLLYFNLFLVMSHVYSQITLSKVLYSYNTYSYIYNFCFEFDFISCGYVHISKSDNLCEESLFETK